MSSHAEGIAQPSNDIGVAGGDSKRFAIRAGGVVKFPDVQGNFAQTPKRMEKPRISSSCLRYCCKVCSYFPE